MPSMSVVFASTTTALRVTSAFLQAQTKNCSFTMLIKTKCSGSWVTPISSMRILSNFTKELIARATLLPSTPFSRQAQIATSNFGISECLLPDQFENSQEVIKTEVKSLGSRFQIATAILLQAQNADLHLSTILAQVKLLIKQRIVSMETRSLIFRSTQNGTSGQVVQLMGMFECLGMQLSRQTNQKLKNLEVDLRLKANKLK